jgi:hypothetical protein
MAAGRTQRSRFRQAAVSKLAIGALAACGQIMG